ncbi:MAG: acyltransferase [Arenimonas sp.]|uniref:acyltransferase family protein n=1 Tax=Arenimonas sp. TaxID=1872635 RepID=UPI0025C45A29|nr:acyltransferase [Arenimonas sp.]MBW8368993.1 acyltransferase [Arenimonas sp.]
MTTPSLPQETSTPVDEPGASWWHVFLGRPGARRHHFDALDGLRGLAVLIVLLSHFSNYGVLVLPGIGLSGIGKSGVYLFFVLSAFLLTRVLLERPLAKFADGWLWADYALRRVLRIWPLYLVVLLVSWWLTRAGVQGWHYVIDTGALIRHLRLQEGQSVLWSIPVEFTFYLWLPLLALAFVWVQHRRWPWPVEAVLAILALAGAAWAWPAQASAVNDVRLGPYLVIFLCGAMAARWDHRLRHARTRPRQATWAAVGVAAMLACALSIPQVWAWLSGDAADGSLNHRWFLFFGVVWSLLLLAVLHGPQWLRAPFEWAPSRLLGVVSFSAYLWHMPILDGLLRVGVAQWPLAAAVVLAASIAAAMLSYLLFERPLRDVRLRRAGRSGAGGTPPQA